MRIAFYAPMKPPDHETPSGDRQMARLLIRVMTEMGHEVDVVSRLRTWQGHPDPATFARLKTESEGECRRITSSPHRPDVFVTYHVYYKAPDWIGPNIAAALDIPYVVVEASHAAHRGDGPWADGLQASETALRAAHAVVSMNARDRQGLINVAPCNRLFELKPFIDASPFLNVVHNQIDKPPRLLTVAMMREGDKTVSYRVLAAALNEITKFDWRLTVVGDGPVADDIRSRFPKDRTRFAGRVSPDALPDIYAASDLFVWPGYKEAFGLVYLEAMAAGLPVVGGLSGGVPDIVIDGHTGLLAPPENAEAQAAAIRRLIENGDLRRRMGGTARRHVKQHHDIPAAKASLTTILEAAFAEAGKGRI